MLWCLIHFPYKARPKRRGDKEKEKEENKAEDLNLDGGGGVRNFQGRRESLGEGWNFFNYFVILLTRASLNNENNEYGIRRLRTYS